MKKHNIIRDQLYNADETGLFWKILPDKTYVSHQEKIAPGKKSVKQKILSMYKRNRQAQT